MRARALARAMKGERQALDSDAVLPEEEGKVSSCVKCNNSFSEPLELTVRTEGSIETYHACPHCFSRVAVSETSEKRPDEDAASAITKAIQETAKEIEKEKPVSCAHFLGYLKTRKGSPIPDDCLTCVSVMQCMGFVQGKDEERG